jgi:hypothetical protein
MNPDAMKFTEYKDSEDVSIVSILVNLSTSFFLIFCANTFDVSRDIAISKNNFFIFLKNKKAEPFDAYLKLGYRQVTVQNNKHKQPTP